MGAYPNAISSGTSSSNVFGRESQSQGQGTRGVNEKEMVDIGGV